MTWLITLFARRWLIAGCIAAFVAYSGWLSWKVHSITTRNLTAYYERQIAQQELEAEKAKLKAEKQHEIEMAELQNWVNLLDIPVSVNELRGLCNHDPNCKESTGGGQAK